MKIKKFVIGSECGEHEGALDMIGEEMGNPDHIESYSFPVEGEKNPELKRCVVLYCFYRTDNVTISG